MVDEEDRGAPIDDLAQVAAEGDRLLCVEAGSRLVEAQQLGARRQRPGDGDELALALGELARRHVGEVAEREHLERLVDRAVTWPSGRTNNSFSVVPTERDGRRRR